jgi:hypothetical protein
LATQGETHPAETLSSPVPRFRQPEVPRQDPTPEGLEDLQDPSLDRQLADLGRRGVFGDLPGLLNRKPASDTPTDTSSGGSSGPPPKASAKDAGKVVAGLVGLAAAGATYVLRRRLGQRLRRPTKTEATDIGEPLGAILWRHTAKYWSWLGPDLVDLINAGTAAGAYINAGPLLEYDYPDAGVPADLQTPQGETT